MSTAQKFVAGIVVSALMGIGLGYVIATRVERSSVDPSPSAAAAAAPSHAGQPLYWYDPMNPQQHFDQPGKSPFMDMELVPKYAESGKAATAGTTIDPRVAHSLAIRYATVEKARLGTTVQAPATVVFNERDVAIVQARAAGYVERVYARAPGDLIASGAPLADILVPEWSALQIEFQAMKAAGDVGLIAAVRQRMQLAGMPEALIMEIERTGQARRVVTIRSPLAGAIQELGVRAGMSVQAGTTLARINGLSPVWIEAAVPAAQAGAVKRGQPAAVTLEGMSSAPHAGTVTAILPEINRESRTLRVRVELPNPGGTVRPGMFGSVQLSTGQAEALTMPAEAVIRTGSGARVIAADAEGRLRPVPVTLGAENGGRVVVVAGLNEGDRVVASGQFLIDSEANLTGALARLSEPALAAAATPAGSLHRARGRVASIENGRITLAHGPVPSLNWPSMTMTFALSSPALATQIAPGDTVDFSFVERNGAYVVQDLEKVKP